MGKMGICGEMAVNYEGPMALSALVLPAMRRLHDNSHWTTKDSRLEDEQGADD